MFETGLDDWKYATDGGTAFIVCLNRRLYALTVRHLARTFSWNDLAISSEKFGNTLVGIDSLIYTDTKNDLSADTNDMMIIEISDDISFESFGDQPYLIDTGTWCDSETGDQLYVSGAQKSASVIDEERGQIFPGFMTLEFRDAGPTSDPVVRAAHAIFDDDLNGGLTGLSGAPVFNWSKERLVGVMVRGGESDGHFTMRYIGIGHYIQMLLADQNGSSTCNYRHAVSIKDMARGERLQSAVWGSKL